jgi:hypothetical protein
VRVYVTSFNGYPVLKEDRRSLINDLALSDSSLQDALSYADAVDVVERTEDEQLYVDFDINSGARRRLVASRRVAMPRALSRWGVRCRSCAGGRTIYATVTSDGARLYALFCIGATAATEDLFKMMRASLRTIK